MQVKETSRGFRVIEHPCYPQSGSVSRLVQESSAIGEYADAFEKPGSSYLYVGNNHHLTREEVAELVEHMRHWLETGRLPEPKD